MLRCFKPHSILFLFLCPPPPHDPCPVPPPLSFSRQDRARPRRDRLPAPCDKAPSMKTFKPHWWDAPGQTCSVSCYPGCLLCSTYGPQPPPSEVGPSNNIAHPSKQACCYFAEPRYTIAEMLFVWRGLSRARPISTLRGGGRSWCPGYGFQSCVKHAIQSSHQVAMDIFPKKKTNI